MNFVWISNTLSMYWELQMHDRKSSWLTSEKLAWNFELWKLLEYQQKKRAQKFNLRWKNKNVSKALVDNRYQWCFPESWKENNKELENMRPNGSV